MILAGAPTASQTLDTVQRGAKVSLLKRQKNDGVLEMEPGYASFGTLSKYVEGEGEIRVILSPTVFL